MAYSDERRGRADGASVAAGADRIVSILLGTGAGVNGEVAVPLPVAPLLVDTRQAAALLGVSAGTIRNLIARGELRPVRLGRRVLFSVRELERLIERRTGGAA